VPSIGQSGPSCCVAFGTKVRPQALAGEQRFSLRYNLRLTQPLAMFIEDPHE